MFPKRMIEWRQIKDSPNWHFFIGPKSVCGKATSNGEFNFADTKPPNDAKVCKLCKKETESIKVRFNAVL